MPVLGFLLGLSLGRRCRYGEKCDEVGRRMDVGSGDIFRRDTGSDNAIERAIYNAFLLIGRRSANSVNEQSSCHRQ